MSKEQTPITAEEYPRLYGWQLKNENGVEMAILPAEKIRKLVEWCEKEDERTQAKVLEALEPIIQECKKVIDSPNHLESTKGFASIIWHELEQSKQK